MSELSFKQLENAQQGDTFSFVDLKAKLKFDKDGLIPAIAQQFDTHEVLMLAYMNLDSLEETLATGRVCYWSRSRQNYWRKGEESGQIQLLKEAHLDCDGDTLLLLVDQTGPACHTGRQSCFYNLVTQDEVKILTEPLINPADLYKSK